MRELQVSEIMDVSGAGKVQDTISSWYGSVFSKLYNATSSFTTAFGDSEEAATTTGQELGSAIGGVIEAGISAWAAKLTSLIS